MTTLSDVSVMPRRAPGDAEEPRRWVRRRPAQRPRLWVELLLIVSCYLVYSMVRNAVPEHEALAQEHTRSIWAIEQGLGIAVEESVNHAINSVTWLIVAMNYYYATLHFLVTLLVLVWLYRAHPSRFVVFRTILLVATGIALVIFYLYPLAPPRLMTGGGFIDTVLAHNTWGSFASPSVASASNQFAAMPSMHFGWSLWCGVAIAVAAYRPWVRILGAIYPLATLLVIVATGNHFWLDAVGGGLTMAVAACVALLASYRRVSAPSPAPPVAAQA